MVIQLLNWNILVRFRSIFGLIWMGFGYKIWPSKVIWLIWLGRFGNRMLTPICLLKMTLIETIKLIYTKYEFIPFDIFFFFLIQEEVHSLAFILLDHEQAHLWNYTFWLFFGLFSWQFYIVLWWPLFFCGFVPFFVVKVLSFYRIQLNNCKFGYF